MHALVQALQQQGRRIALIEDSGETSCTQLADTVGDWVQALRDQGTARGDVLSIETDFCRDGIALLLAAEELGLIAVPVSSADERIRLQRRQIAGAHWHFDGRAIVPQKDPCPYPRLYAKLGSDAGLVLFSSGTTGEPKAMLHNLTTLLAGYPPKPPRDLRLLAFLYMDHIGGLDTLWRALAGGTTLVLPRERSPEAIARLIEEHRVQVLPASPTFLNLLLISGALERHDCRSLTLVGYGAEPMPPALLRRLHEALPGVVFQQKFGTSETNAVRVTSAATDDLALKIDDPRVEYRIVDGELWLRSQSQVLGYLNAPADRFTSDGWFRTGDLVEELEDGYLRILGRETDVINVGGEKVLPSEVESCLLELEEVRDCQVAARPHALTGQCVAARIVTAPGTDSKALKRSLRRHCRTRLEPYKVPAYIEFVEALATGERIKKERRPPRE